MLHLAHPGLIAWLLAAAIPAAIHLLTRQERRRMDLPTIRFLQQTLARQSRIFRLRYLLLLLLRTLAVGMLVLAFLKPESSPVLSVNGTGRQGAVFLLDVSASMGYNAGGLTSLARARGDAVRALEELPRGSIATVVVCGAQARTLLAEPTDDLAAVRSAISQAAVTEERGDPASAVNLAVEQFGRMVAQTKRLYVFSDFQRTNWASVKLEAVPPETRLLLDNVDPGSRENVGITALRVHPSSPRAGEPVILTCELFNSSSRRRRVPVSFRFSDGGHYAQTVSVEPFSTGTASLPLLFSTPRRLECTAALPPDSLALDDTRRVVIDLRQTARVILLTDEDASRPPAAAFFLSRALQPDPTSQSGFRVTTVRPPELNNVLLHAADLVVVCNAPEMPDVQYEALSRYVTGSGSLVWFLYGERIPVQLAAFGRRLPAAEPLPCQVVRIQDLSGNGRGYVTLAEARYESPLLKAFKDRAAAGLAESRFKRICITTEVAPRAEVLLKYGDGTAAALKCGEGSGNLLLLNMAPTPEWSDLARQEIFVPLLHEMLKGLLARDSDTREFYPGGGASTSLAALPVGHPVTCAGPSGDIPVTADPQSGSVVLERAPESGFYHVEAGGAVLASLAVNPHPDESDLRAVDPRELEQPRQKQLTYFTGQGGQKDDLERASRGTPLWPVLISLCLLLLLLEQVVCHIQPRVRS